MNMYFSRSLGYLSAGLAQRAQMYLCKTFTLSDPERVKLNLLGANTK